MGGGGAGIGMLIPEYLDSACAPRGSGLPNLWTSGMIGHGDHVLLVHLLVSQWGVCTFLGPMGNLADLRVPAPGSSVTQDDRG